MVPVLAQARGFWSASMIKQKNSLASTLATILVLVVVVCLVGLVVWMFM